MVLLIVPYGIETPRLPRHRVYCSKLLIVPYGIETKEIEKWGVELDSFNRTLWN